MCLHCDLWFEKDGFLHHRVLKLMNQTLGLSAGFLFGSLWYAPLPFALPARTPGRVLAATYIWHIKEWVCILLPCLLTGHGGAEQKQHVRAPFSKIFSKLCLGVFAVSRRLKNAHKHMQSPSKVCYVCHGAEELTSILLEQEQSWRQDCCSGAPAAFHLSVF